jgi:rSAM/selenodomain-associated transferase 1
MARPGSPARGARRTVNAVTRPALVAAAIMAKTPAAGRVKTRLCPPLSSGEAADLYRCFLLDKIGQVRALAGATPVVAFTPEDDREIFRALAPDFLLLPQRGPDLSARLTGVLQHLLASGHDGALATDSDTPTLPVPLLQEAVDRLADPGIDAVLGPTEDGGYYLIGLRAPRPELFVQMPWSTAAVFSETMDRARRLGLRVALLPPWRDVDTPHDLDRLRAELAGTEAPGAPHTRRLLQQLAPAAGT